MTYSFGVYLYKAQFATFCTLPKAQSDQNMNDLNTTIITIKDETDNETTLSG